MKAIGLYQNLPISDPRSLVDIELPPPATPTGRDLLIAVRALAVNPVDYKVRSRPVPEAQQPKILGWDAAGEVVATGPEVALFSPGDRVFYAGDITRPGCNSELQLVDERIVGRMPQSLDWSHAAALPLTAITAWEALFDRLQVPSPPHAQPPRSILIFGGAGGVGSIAIQLASRVAGMRVIATASRPESAQWCREMGAMEVVNHFEELQPQLDAIGLPQVDFALILNDLDRHFPAAAAAIAPQGAICTIIEGKRPAEVDLLKQKSASLHWEFMFTRSMFKTPDMIRQHHLLNEIARLVDAGIIHTTASQLLAPITAEHLRQAHATLEAGRTTGKIVLQGWE